MFFSALIFSMSAAVAHADPSFVLAESQARAGETVHFSITGAEDRVTYEIEVADRDVAEGEADADGGAVSGQFTMPDLGGSAKSVTVEADIRDDGNDRTTVKRKLQYLGPALAAPVPAPQPAAAPAAPQQTASAPAPAHTPAARETKTSPAPAVKHRKKRVRRRHRPTRRTAPRHRETTSSNAPATRRKDTKPKRSKRHAARTAPLFDGVPEADSGGYSAGDYEESEERERKLPAGVVTTPTSGRVGGEPASAILVPGLLGLAGFLLAAATVLRRRRRR